MQNLNHFYQEFVVSRIYYKKSNEEESYDFTSSKMMDG